MNEKAGSMWSTKTKTCPSATLSATSLILTGVGLKPSVRGARPLTNRQSPRWRGFPSQSNGTMAQPPRSKALCTNEDEFYHQPGGGQTRKISSFYWWQTSDLQLIQNCEDIRGVWPIPLLLLLLALQSTVGFSLPPHTLDHTLWHTTVGGTPLHERSVRRRDLYLTTHNTYNRQTSMHPAWFEPATPASDRPQTLALNRSACLTHAGNKM